MTICVQQDYDIEILNTIRDNASTEYQEAVPEATQENINTIGNAIKTYDPKYGEFTGLLNKIALEKVHTRSFTDRLSVFDRGMMPYGTTMQEIVVNMAEQKAFDPDGKTTLDRVKSDIKQMFHEVNKRTTTPYTIQDSEMTKAFTAQGGVTRLIDAISLSARNREVHNKYLYKKNQLALHSDYYSNIEVNPITDQASAIDFVKRVWKVALDLTNVGCDFNSGGFETMTPISEQYLLINQDVWVEINAEVWAKVFNGKQYLDFLQNNIIVMDDFGSLADTYALLIDKETLMWYDAYVGTEEQRNAQGRFTNTFIHNDALITTSRFTNAVRFTPANVTDANDIVAYSFVEQTGLATIDSVAHTVAIEVAAGTDVTDLVPTIVVSPDATIVPASGVADDFTNPVVYTVTSTGGTDQTWTVTVTVAS